jgi:arylsulfatase A-like enzyme
VRCSPAACQSARVPLPGEPGHYGLASWEYTLADLLSDSGYATACYGKWHLGNVEGRFPTDQGFDEWWRISESSDAAAYTAHELYPTDGEVPKIYESARDETPAAVADFDLSTRRFMDEGIADRTVAFIERNAQEGQPFFAFAAWTNVHPPMMAHPDFGGAAPCEHRRARLPHWSDPRCSRREPRG